MKRVLHEPLIHFLLLGAALFGAYAALNRNQPAAQNEILVSAGQVENLAASFAKVWQRPPTAEELKAQIDQFVEEEMLSREAIKLGLDQNDTVIRRRLQQKMEFLAEDFATTVAPTDAELADYLANHPDTFRREPRLTFQQVFLDPQKHLAQLPEIAEQMLMRLNQSDVTNFAELGDQTLLPHELTNESLRGVAALFGSEFALALTTQKTNSWVGPVTSAFGVHLVRIDSRVEGHLPLLIEVRDEVAREWMNERRLAAQQKFQEELLSKYQVKIEWPKVATPSTNTTAAMK